MELLDQLNRVMTSELDAYEALFKPLGQFNRSDCSLFQPQIGKNYDTSCSELRLLVIGRSANEWHPLCNEKTVLEVFEGKRKEFCFLTNVLENTNSKYLFWRSAFWQSVRDISSKFLGVEPNQTEQWSSKLAWSNLYKIGLTSGLGTPSKMLKADQEAGAKRIINAEIDVLKPSAIVILTGFEGWAANFLDSISEFDPSVGSRQMGIEAVGLVRGVKTIVIPHPQGKSGRTECIKAVVDKIKKLER